MLLFVVVTLPFQWKKVCALSESLVLLTVMTAPDSPHPPVQEYPESVTWQGCSAIPERSPAAAPCTMRHIAEIVMAMIVAGLRNQARFLMFLPAVLC